MALILASRSPRRSELLRQCGVDFSVEISPVQELDNAPDITALPQLNAALKAAAAADRNPEKWVLGADTMIVFENSAIGKPADLAEAAHFLRRFSGKSHQVITGMALICRSKQVEEVWSMVIAAVMLPSETVSSQ